MKRPNDKKFRILSLDGGGVRGYLSAVILSNIETYLNSLDGQSLPLGKRFDLIAGTSTGGLIALGLAVGKTAKSIVEFYDKNIPEIFSDKMRRSPIKRLYSPKYDPTALSVSLVSFFDEKTLNDVATDVCITAVSLQNGNPRFYKSDYMKRNQARLDELLTDICLSTSAAPSYFPAHSSKYSSNLIDGGVCANNPAMIAFVEAFQFERPSLRGISSPTGLSNIGDELTVVSIGTGTQCAMPYEYKKLANGGMKDWALVYPFMEIAMQGQTQIVHHQLNFLMGAGYLRVNPDLKFTMPLDDAENYKELKNVADIDSRIENFLTTSF